MMRVHVCAGVYVVMWIYRLQVHACVERLIVYILYYSTIFTSVYVVVFG